MRSVWVVSVEIRVRVRRTLIMDDNLEEDQEEDGDDRDTLDMWNITVEDVERIRKFLTPNVPDIIEDVIQPLIPTTLHTTPPNEDYVAPATKPILDELLKDKILNVAMVDEETDSTRDLEELERLFVEDSYFTKIQVHSVITKPEPFIHTQPMSPLYEIFKSYKSSTKPYKVDRETKSPSSICSSRFKRKKMLWDYLSFVIGNWDGEAISMGDFNEVRDISERFGSIFNKYGTEAFNSFIVNAGLVKVPLGGCSFTWCHKSAKKMSKLDRFLISDNLMCSCPSISFTSLDRFLSDHRPIIMWEAHYDYGLIP
nr:RNA-directed DNA polymerase, eukaryota [Tanacetum cinerariifolium]